MSIPSQRLPTVESPNSKKKNVFRFDIFNYTAKSKFNPKEQQKAPIRQKSQNLLKRQPQSFSKKMPDKTIYRSMIVDDEVKQQEQTQQMLEKQVKELQERCNQLEDLNKSQKNEIDNLTIQIRTLQYKYLEKSKQSLPNDVNELQTKYKQLKDEFLNYQLRMEEQLKTTVKSSFQNNEKIVLYQKKAEQLQISTMHLKQQLQCKYCNKQLNDAVTLIPCAHSYCRYCTKGYQKKCYICGDDIKVEATYYNKFMAELVQMYGTFEDLLKLLQ